MNEKAKELWMHQNPKEEKATRFANGPERLRYDMEAVNKFLPAGGKCLDLCCGTGMMTARIAERAGLVYAVDINPQFLEQIPAKKNIVTVASDAKDFYVDERFDLITIFGAIQYNTGDEVRKIYENCYQMSTVGGHLIVSGQWGVNEKVIVNNFSEELQKDYFAEYRTLKEERALLQEIGYTTELVKILPDAFNRFENTKFMGIVATR